MFRFSPKFPFNLQTLAGVKPPGDSRRPRAGWQVGGGQGAEVWTRKERQILVGGVAWPAPFCTLFPSSHSGPHRWVRTRSCPLRNTCRLITVGSCRGTCGYHGQKQEGARTEGACSDNFQERKALCCLIPKSIEQVAGKGITGP